MIPGLNYMHHIGMTVADLEAATDLYTELFNAKVICRLGPLNAEEMPTMPDGRDWTATHIGVTGASLSITLLEISSNLLLELFQYDKPDDRNLTAPRTCDVGGHHLAVHVDDVDAAAHYLKDKGFEVNSPFMTEEGPFAGMTFCYTRDPWGNYLELVNRGDNPTAPALCLKTQ